MRSASVPAWPLIALEQQGSDVVARWPLGEVRVDASEIGTEVAARRAALDAAERLGVEVCRVQGRGIASEWPMVVDVAAGTLEELDESGPERRRWSRRAKIIAVAASVAIAIPAGVLAASLFGGTAVTPETVEAAPETPAPAQLPVYAPTGWDTYASWAVPVEAAGPVLVGETGTVTVADDARLLTLDAATGVELSSVSTGATITALHQSSSGAVYAAHGREGVAIVDGDRTREAPIEDASEIILGETPVAVLDDQRAAVLVNGSWRQRIVPAGGSVVGAVGTAAVVVDVSRSVLWLIEGTAPELPEPFRLGAGERTSLDRVLAFFAGRLVTAWDGANGTTLRTDLVTRDGLEAVSSAPTPASVGGRVSVDEATATLAVGRVLVDVDTGELVEGSSSGLVAVAGFGWTETVRIGLDGEETTSRDGSAIPAAVLPDGTALVIAAYGDAEAVYRLTTAEEP